MTSCCGAATSDTTKEKPDTLKLEFLFLDETVCKPCGGTGQALDEAAALVAGPLAALGMTLEMERVHVASREDAIAHRLVTSPTIRINGIDIDPDRTEVECGSCGDIAGEQTTVNCRTWHWKGEVYSSAPTGKIVEAILSAATAGNQDPDRCCAGSGEEAGFALPQNLEEFFRARGNGEQRCC